MTVVYQPEKWPRFTEGRAAVIEVLARQGGELVDESGGCVDKLRGMAATDAGDHSFRQLVVQAEQAGLLVRERRRRRTVRIALADELPPKFVEHLEQTVPEYFAPPEPAPLVSRDEPDSPPPTTDDAGVDYDQMAAALLRAAARALDNDPSAVRAELSEARERLGEARQRLGEALDETKRLRTRTSLLEDDNRRLNKLVSDLRATKAQLENNIDTMRRDHHRAVAVALSDHDRRVLERTMTELPVQAGV